jgi:hypothetical protein
VAETEDEHHTLVVVVVGIDSVGFGNVAEVGVGCWGCFVDAVV